VSTRGASGKANLIRFVLPSSLGIFCFLTPVTYGGKVTILIGVLTSLANELLAESRIPLLLFIVSFSASLTTLVSLQIFSVPNVKPVWRDLIDVSRLWVILRVLGATCAWMIYLKQGPEWIWHDSTGQIALNDLAGGIMTLFIFAAFLLPLLTDFGFMEFVGASVRGVFRRVFNLPGRSVVDAMASWLTAAAVGITITSQQYQRGFYTARESAVIATNFSITSLPFCLLTTEFIGLGHAFFQVYATVFVLGLIAAIITPRLPPLSRIPDEFFPGTELRSEEKTKNSRVSGALQSALERAAQAPGLMSVMREATKNVLDIWFGLLPAVVLLGTLGMAIVEYTPIMQWLSWPFVWLLELLRLPEAHLAAPTMVVGFFEMFLPAAVGASIESELTRFVVCCVGLTQLIYMSEVGVLILKTPLPLNFLNLAQIFLLRTLIVLPLSAAIAHLLY
jgi:nucleoside recognition membrane protein YjiH